MYYDIVGARTGMILFEHVFRAQAYIWSVNHKLTIVEDSGHDLSVCFTGPKASLFSAYRVAECNDMNCRGSCYMHSAGS